VGLARLDQLRRRFSLGAAERPDSTGGGFAKWQGSGGGCLLAGDAVLDTGTAAECVPAGSG
jgi:hypothetical protein